MACYPDCCTGVYECLALWVGALARSGEGWFLGERGVVVVVICGGGVARSFRCSPCSCFGTCVCCFCSVVETVGVLA